MNEKREILPMRDQSMIELSERTKQWMRARGMSPFDLSRALGVRRGMVCHFLKKRTSLNQTEIECLKRLMEAKND